MNFQTIVEKLAESNAAGTTWFSVMEVVAIAHVLAVAEPLIVDLTTPEARAQFAKGLPEADEAAKNGKRIVAIKAVREASHGAGFIHPDGDTVMGLKNAKDAVDTAFPAPKRCAWCNR